MSSKNINRERIRRQLTMMQKDRVDYLSANPLQNDLYIWHFTFRGPQNTDYHEGIYHGQILLPFQYPFKPPDIIFSNKNGRFQVNTKICLTITQYHTEEWNSAWTIRTMLQAVISLFNQRVVGHGYLDCSSDIRKYLAKASQQYVCQKCGKIKDIVKPRKPIVTIKQQEQVKNSFNQFINEKINSKQSNKQTIRQSKDEQKKIKQIRQKNKNNLQIEEQVLNKPHKTKQRSGQIYKKTNKKYPSPCQFFVQALKIGQQEYLSVINSKKVISL